MKGQTGLQWLLRFFGLRRDTAVEQRLDNLQPYFPIESGKHIQEVPRQTSESLQGRDDRAFRRSITWCDNYSGRVAFAAQPFDVLAALLDDGPDRESAGEPPCADSHVREKSSLHGDSLAGKTLAPLTTNASKNSFLSQG